MFKKSHARMFVLAILFVVPLFFGTTSSVYSLGGGNPEGGISIGLPAGTHLEKPQIVGKLTLVLYVEAGFLGDTLKISGIVEGSCKGVGGKVYIFKDIFADELGILAEGDFTGLGAENLEALTIHIAGPPGCYSADGGEDVNMSKVLGVSHAAGADNTKYINATVILEQVVADAP
jgi:hypothetical protein